MTSKLNPETIATLPEAPLASIVEWFSAMGYLVRLNRDCTFQVRHTVETEVGYEELWSRPMPWDRFVKHVYADGGYVITAG